jgi:hypothetical protein
MEPRKPDQLGAAAEPGAANQPGTSRPPTRSLRDGASTPLVSYSRSGEQISRIRNDLSLLLSVAFIISSGECLVARTPARRAAPSPPVQTCTCRSRIENPLGQRKVVREEDGLGIEAAAVRGGCNPPQPDELLGFVVATADARQRLEVLADFDLLNDALIDEIVGDILLVSDEDEPEPVTVLNDVKQVIDDHEVGELSPMRSSQIWAPSQVPVRSTSDPSWARAPDPKATVPSMLPSARALEVLPWSVPSPE